MFEFSPIFRSHPIPSHPHHPALPRPLAPAWDRRCWGSKSPPRCPWSKRSAWSWPSTWRHGRVQGGKKKRCGAGECIYYVYRRVDIYTYIYIQVYVCIYKYMYVYVCIIYIYIYMYMCMCMCMCICMCVCLSACLPACLSVCMYYCIIVLLYCIIVLLYFCIIVLLYYCM